MKNVVILINFVVVLSTFKVFSQGVAINTTEANPHPSAILDVTSTNSGVLIPRMTQAQRNAISTPADGLLIFQTDNTSGFYYYENGSWHWLFSGNVPSVPGNVEHWVRPSSANFIHPEHNANIRVHDANQTYGLYYDGSTNQYGVFSQTSSATSPTAAVVGFSNVSGNQTYGYLGFNGTYTAPTSGFGSVYGSGVYGIVDDPGRTAGFFRSTGNAEYAALISYSDVWIPGFFYGDHIDSTDASRPSIYAQMNTFVDVTGYQSAVKGYSEYKAGTTNKTGTTVGGSFYGIGNQQDAYGVMGIASCTGTAAYGVGVFGQSSDNRGGTDYYKNNVAAVEGNGAWKTNAYTFGVTGRVAGTGNRQGGVLGTWYTNCYGALGYKNSAGNTFGLLYVGGYTTTAKSGFNSIKSGIGMGGYGDLMGGWIRGNLYGLHLKADRYTLYVDGNHYTNGVIASLSNNSQDENRNLSFVPTSTKIEIQTSGQFELNNKEMIISFPTEFTEQVSNNQPIIVTLTAMGGFVNMYLDYVNSNEFKVIADYSQIDVSRINKKIKVNWIAVGVRKGYENFNVPREILSKEYDYLMDGVMHNESDTETNATPIWWDGNNLHFTPIPEIPLDKNIRRITPEKKEMNRTNSDDR
ncbi:MAG TPA: hypothetical protein PLC87_04930 [Bacteroidales bacterium]|nr:hypothetical protein [Bacteroidales bacterium]